MGWDAKTDCIDAKVLARCGEIVKPLPEIKQSEVQRKLAALVERRRQLVDPVNQEQNRLQQTSDSDSPNPIGTVLKVLKH